MIERDLWSLRHPDAPMAASFGTRAMCEEWRNRDPLRRPPDTYILRKEPSCQCCGSLAVVLSDRGIVRCRKHLDRNPCAIDGCRRSFSAKRDAGGVFYHNAEFLCGKHWRALVPPGSAERRVHLRFFRTAKKIGGFDAPLARRYWRVWARIVAVARSRAAGDIDEAEIRRLFGWDAPR